MNSLACLFRFARWWLLAGAVVSLSQAAYEERVEKTERGDLPETISAVRIDHMHGQVRVVGADDNFGWSWTLNCSAEKRSEVEAFANDCTLEVEQTRGTLQVKLVLPERRSFGGSRRTTRAFFGLFEWLHSDSGIEIDSRLELRLPRAVALEVKNRFGHTRVSSLTGPVTATGENGAVDITGVSGPVIATASFGALNAERIGPAQLRVQNGDLRVRGVNGELRAAGSFGRMQVEEVRGAAFVRNQNGEIVLRDIAGDVQAEGSFGKLIAERVSGQAELRNQNGAIEAREIARELVASTSFGDLKVAQLKGAATLKCQNGRIEVADAAGDVTASNSFAPLRVQNVKGDARLESQNGELTAQGVEGAVQAKTSFGRLLIEGDGKRFDVQNQNGSVHITARSPAVQRIYVSTSFGPIEVKLPEGTKPLIRAETSHGAIRSEFPVTLGKPERTEKGVARDDTTLQVTLRGQNGDIRVQSLAAK